MKKLPASLIRTVCFPGLLLTFIFTSCQKNADTLNSSLITAASDDSVIIKDAGITVKTGILPPVTQKTFIPNGDSSIAEFQVVAAKNIFLRRMDFSAPSIIKSSRISSIYDDKIANDTGTMTYYIDRYLKPGSGADLLMEIFYKHVNTITSGSTARVSLTHFSYVSLEDNVEHDVYLNKPVKTNIMCLVFNKPGIVFQNPAGTVLNNGFREIMQVKLTGASRWSLADLPIFIYAPPYYNGSVKKCRLIVKNKNTTLATESDSLRVPAEGSGSTVIHFTPAFQHVAGDTDTLKIYARVSGTLISLISSMSPYSGLAWKDAVSTRFGGNVNNNFFKDDTYFSSFYYQE
ncbi:hypothetical protein [Parafilimonas sp.]|uniref:hypothetical protein n=1 Tax=Parafilimonas sp. TaxID=1969739 RepID=UPI0039E6243D